MHYDSRGLTGSGHVVPFGGPAAAHARQHKSLGLSGEDLSEGTQ